MTIDQKTGDIALPEIGAFITPTLLRSQFLASAAFSGASVSIQNEPWCSYRLPTIAQPDTELAVVVQFHGEPVVAVTLMHGAARFGSSWSDWSQESELARKAFHEHWLSTALRLPLGDYSWGSVWSGYDPKGGFSSVVVRYHPRTPNHALQTCG